MTDWTVKIDTLRAATEKLVTDCSPVKMATPPLTSPPAPVTITDVKVLTKTVGRPRSEVTSHFGRWLDANGWTREAAAKELGVTRGQIDKLARGVAVPKLMVMWDIHVLTKGKVGLQQWVMVALDRDQARRQAGVAPKRQKG